MIIIYYQDCICALYIYIHYHHYTGHKIDFNNLEILAEEKNYWKRLIIEGHEIRKAGYEIHDSWGAVLDGIQA